MRNMRFALLVLLVAGLVPSFASAQASAMDPSYLEALNEFVATLPENMEEPSQAPIPLGEDEPDISASGEDIAQEQAFSLLAAPSGLYDYAVNFVSLNGNIPAVAGCDTNGQGQFRSFFDGFGNGQVDTGCTSHFVKHLGTFTESGGLLRMNSENGQQVGDIVHHLLQYDTPFQDGSGSFGAGTDFRLDLPPQGGSYGTYLIDLETPGSLPALSMQVVQAPSGAKVLIAGQNSAEPQVFRAALASTTATTITFGALFNDATNTLTPRYSYDLGSTFSYWYNPDGSTTTMPLFTASPAAVFQVFGFAPAPEEPDGPDPVIIIPGILGSWEKDGELLIDPIFHTYDDLIATLDANGYTLDLDLFTFPYEWRNSNAATAVLLKQKIDQVKSGCNCGKVDLIAHSMGGLVARHYIQSATYEDDVDQIIFLGTPHLGAPQSYLMWEGGVVDPAKLSGRMLQRILDQEAEEEGYSNLFDYVRNRPALSIQELVPIYSYIFDGSGLRNYPDNYPLNVFLTNLNAGVDSLLNSGVDIHNIISDDSANTIVGINVANVHEFQPMWEHGYPIGFYEGVGNLGLERGAGDSTVPFASAAFIQSNLLTVSANHDELPDEAKTDIYQILTDQEPETIVDSNDFPNIGLIIQMRSPADLLVVAPDGKKIGKENAQEVNEISGAFYTGFSAETEFVTIFNPLDGEYRIIVEGTDDGGEYTIITDYFNGGTLVEREATSHVLPGDSEEVTLTVNASSPEESSIEETTVITYADFLDHIRHAHTLGWISDVHFKSLLEITAKKADKFNELNLRALEKVTLGAFLVELRLGQRREKLNHEAYELLKADATFLLKG